MMDAEHGAKSSTLQPRRKKFGVQDGAARLLRLDAIQRGPGNGD